MIKASNQTKVMRLVIRCCQSKRLTDQQAGLKADGCGNQLSYLGTPAEALMASFLPVPMFRIDNIEEREAI